MSVAESLFRTYLVSCRIYRLQSQSRLIALRAMAVVSRRPSDGAPANGRPTVGGRPAGRSYGRSTNKSGARLPTVSRRALDRRQTRATGRLRTGRCRQHAAHSRCVTGGLGARLRGGVADRVPGGAVLGDWLAIAAWPPNCVADSLPARRKSWVLVSLGGSLCVPKQ